MTNSSAAPRPTAPPHPKRRLLVAEDDPAFRRFLHDALTAQGYEVVVAKHGVELLDQLNFSSQEDDCLGNFDVVVTDYHLPGLTGLEVLEGLAAAGAGGRVVVISAFADEATVKWAISIGASAMLAKPFQIDELIDAIEKASQNPIELGQELSGRS